MTEPYTMEGHDPVEVLLQRGRKRYVRTVLVAGEVLLRDGKHELLDRTELVRKLKESIAPDYAGKYEAARREIEPLRAALRRWFEADSRELEKRSPRPFYRLNDRG